MFLAVLDPCFPRVAASRWGWLFPAMGRLLVAEHGL